MASSSIGDASELASAEPSSHDISPSCTTSLSDNDQGTKKPDVNSNLPGMSSLSLPSAPELQTATLQFFSTASPSALVGVVVGCAAVIYVTLGRLGLVVIGAAIGAASVSYWQSTHPDLAKAVHGERGAHVIDKIMADLRTAGHASGDGDPDDDDQTVMKSFDDFQPETREALGSLVDAVIRDYVKWWYNPIVPADHSFPLVCRKALISYIIAISNRMSRKRPADMLLDLLTNSSSMIIVFFSELATAFSELPPESNRTAIDTVYNYLAENPESRLTDLLNQRQQNAKFKMVAEDLLGFLDKNSYNCDPVRVFLREIIANSVLEKTLQQCSRAEWINGWIVHLLEAGEPNLNQAIDVGMQTGRDMANNVFADLDGNVGNVSIAKPRRGSADLGGRRKEPPAHKKKLSKADEELEEAMEEMKRMNAMIAEDNARRERAATVTGSSERPKQSMDMITRTTRTNSVTPVNTSPSSGAGKSSPRGHSLDGLSTKSEIVYTPHTPGSISGSLSQASSSSPQQAPAQAGDHAFTNFDQIVPPSKAESEDESPRKAELTLHNAAFTLHDDASDERGKIRNKPSTDYLIQVEPCGSGYPGWMIVRRYSDFETLHEILRRIAAVSGATAFIELHKELPSWKSHTRASLRGDLERYLRDACWYPTLAESEGMKRFLEKSQGHTHANSKTFGWEAVGKNMLGVLSNAPKGAMEGGKTLVGGVSGVFAGLGRKTTVQAVEPPPPLSASRLSISTGSRETPTRSPVRSDRASLDSQRSSVISTQPGKIAPMERRPSFQAQDPQDGEGESVRPCRRDRMGSVSISGRPSREHSRASSLAPVRSPSVASLDLSKLPPPPDEIPDDYGSPRESRGRPSGEILPTAEAKNASKKPPGRQFAQLAESETRVAVELIFAVINEMYTLSSAWNIRRTLLAAAKSFLLRPGNPSLLTVQSLIQTTVLDANTSDRGIAAQLRMLRANAVPTDEERSGWPAEMTAEEKEKLAVRARQLLIQSGVPAALTGVMGQAATGEALGRVFDCLQIEEVARGLIFGLLLQFVRVITH